MKKQQINYSHFFYEIKNRFFLLIITVISITLTTYFYKETLLFTICLNSSFSFIYTNITEVFSIYMKLISFVCNQVILGYFLFHFLIFLSPGLYKKEYYYLKIFFYLNFITVIFSIFFFNLIMFPFSCNFFLSFQNIIFKSLNFYLEAKINDYLNFYIILYYTCFFYFQFFVCLGTFFYILERKLKEIKFFRKLFYFLFYAISLFIYSFDLTGQTLFCISFFFFYELLIFNVLIKKNLHFLSKNKILRLIVQLVERSAHNG